MLSDLKEFHRILLIGGKSELALSILATLPMSEHVEIYLCGRNMSEVNLEVFPNSFDVHTLEVDFTNQESSVAEIEKVFSAGDIDLVIVAYAILGDENSQLETRQFKEVLDTNFISQAVILNLVNSKLRAQMHGQILLISSVAGMRPRRRNFVYGASKMGVDFIAQGLQLQNVGKNIFITILRPGFVYTKMTKGLVPAPFALDKLAVSKIAVSGLLKKKNTVYAPKILRLVMFVLKLMPANIFRVLDK